MSAVREFLLLPDFSEHLSREREANHFVTRKNAPVEPPASVKGGTDPLFCVAFVTVRREADDYFDPSVGSLLVGLDPRERRELHLHILFADTDPMRHPSWGQKWVDRLTDISETYNVTARRHHHRGGLDGKDAKSISRHQANAVEQTTLDLPSPFYTEPALGWESSDFAYRNMPLVFATAMLFTFSCLTVIRRLRPYRSLIDFPTTLAISVICVPAFIPLMYMIGKYSLFPLHGVAEIAPYGCCTQGMVFPRDQVDGLIAYLQKRGHGQTDTMIEEYAEESKLTRYALIPQQLQHVGLKSSRDNTELNAQSTWAFYFEQNVPKLLRKEHDEILQDREIGALLDKHGAGN
ncbi:hypothetical protein TESG_05509 [Trichophyton tonsurans CBS 112818]|uniref:Integral membrane protein n=1 Tax=Trichophyton tonsurans (strain CBS 112818) TaxID=647933 RepID=F2S3H3_TRIT1|nr:hypothetical protein TESG_05509 [Trichophyton tonsurans CBS 112818]